MVRKSLFDSQLEKVWWPARGVFWKGVDPYFEIELRLSEYYVDSLFWEHYTEKESKISYVTISLWNATEWSDEMETLAREKYVPLVMSMGASSVKMVQTWELSFAVITTYDSEETATAAQQRIAEIRAQAATEMPMQMESSMQGGVFASS